jgi:hypothetical protein
MNQCVFWGKFWFENCTLLQKRALSAGRGLRTPCTLPLDPPMGIEKYAGGQAFTCDQQCHFNNVWSVVRFLLVPGPDMVIY